MNSEGIMEEQPSTIVLEAIAVKALAVPFSPGLTQEKKDAVTDHMLAVQEAIEGFCLADFPGHGRHR